MEHIIIGDEEVHNTMILKSIGCFSFYINYLDDYISPTVRYIYEKDNTKEQNWKYELEEALKDSQGHLKTLRENYERLKGA